ncbi:MAG: hypothetical protein ACRD1U_16950 [Vicinamibacterales bacterium]
MNRWLLGVVVGVPLLLGTATAQGGRGAAESAPPEMMFIDGAKNPELIPQWSAWGYAFRVISGGPRELPSIVHKVVSADERAMIIKEADAVQKIDKACTELLLKQHTVIGRGNLEALDAKLREITVACRQKTLDARNRILAALNPDGATALIMFVESTKEGTSLTIRKRDLPRFLEPE